MSETSAPPLWPRFIVAILLGCFVAQIWLSMMNKAATYDEQVYVLSGYSFIETGEYNLKQDAPPLIPLLSGFSLKLYQWMGNEIQLSQETIEKLPRIKDLWLVRDFDSTQEYFIAHDFFHENNGPKLIQIARIPIVLIGLLLGLFLYLFALKLFGEIPAMMALALFVLDPNIIGHARVVSADLGLACFFLMTHYYHYRAMVEDKWSNVVMLTMAATLCVGVKLSGIIIFPTLTFVTLFALVRPGDLAQPDIENSRSKFRFATLKKAGVAIGAVLISSWLFLSLLYRDVNSLSIFYRSTQLIYSNVPDGYFSYLNGKFEFKFWEYYPLTIFYKSPLSTSFLFIASLIWFRGVTTLSRWCLWIPIAVAMAISAFDGINIGMRRVLLVLPFMYLSIGGLFGYGVLATASFARKLVNALSFTGLAWAIFSAVQIFPYHLSFFNIAMGGPDKGHLYLAESNVSWGQNLPELAEYLKENNIENPIMSFYGGDSPRSYGIQKSGLIFDSYHLYWPLSTVYVMSKHNMIQFSKKGDDGSNWYESYSPEAIIGHTLYVFDFRKNREVGNSPESSLRIARNFVSEDRNSDALIHYQNYLLGNPEDRNVHLELAKVAEEFNHRDLATFHRQAARSLEKSSKPKQKIESVNSSKPDRSGDDNHE